MSQRRAVSVAAVFFIVCVSVGWFVNSRQEVVHNSLRDGSVRQVKVFLQHNWKDLGLRAPIEWGKVERTSDGNFLVPCTFRTMMRGESGTMEAVFTFDSRGQYVDVKTATRPAAV
jgi:hypothetical protein